MSTGFRGISNGGDSTTLHLELLRQTQQVESNNSLDNLNQLCDLSDQLKNNSEEIAQRKASLNKQLSELEECEKLAQTTSKVVTEKLKDRAKELSNSVDSCIAGYESGARSDTNAKLQRYKNYAAQFGDKLTNDVDPIRQKIANFEKRLAPNPSSGPSPSLDHSFNSLSSRNLVNIPTYRSSNTTTTTTSVSSQQQGIIKATFPNPASLISSKRHQRCLIESYTGTTLLVFKYEGQNEWLVNEQPLPLFAQIIMSCTLIQLQEMREGIVKIFKKHIPPQKLVTQLYSDSSIFSLHSDELLWLLEMFVEIEVTIDFSKQDLRSSKNLIETFADNAKIVTYIEILDPSQKK